MFRTEDLLPWDATSAKGMIPWMTRVDGGGGGGLRERKGNPREHCECGLPLLISYVLCEELYLFLPNSFGRSMGPMFFLHFPQRSFSL